MRSIVLACAALLCAPGAYACSPPAPSDLTDEEKVAQMVAQADDVFVATLVKVTEKPLPPDNEMKAEHVEFKIDKVYKGKRPKGSIYRSVTSGFGATCGVSVKDLAPAAPTRQSRQWIIYSNGSAPHMLYDLGRATPVSRMVGSLEMLDKLRKK